MTMSRELHDLLTSDVYTDAPEYADRVQRIRELVEEESGQQVIEPLWIVTHDGKDAHTNRPIVDWLSRSNLTWCVRCKGWFYPFTTAVLAQKLVDRVDGDRAPKGDPNGGGERHKDV